MRACRGAQRQRGAGSSGMLPSPTSSSHLSGWWQLKVANQLHDFFVELCQITTTTRGLWDKTKEADFMSATILGIPISPHLVSLKLESFPWVKCPLSFLEKCFPLISSTDGWNPVMIKIVTKCLPVHILTQLGIASVLIGLSRKTLETRKCSGERCQDGTGSGNHKKWKTSKRT